MAQPVDRRHAPAEAARPRRWALSAVVVLVAVTAGATRLPFLARPLSPDEGGFLMLAAQWAPGTSLYGDYWVDRPPLLIAVYQLVDVLGGGPVPLRLLGIAAVACSVLLAGLLGHAVARLTECTSGAAWRLPLYAALTAAVFLVSPAFGAREVDGELLATPFVLAGLNTALRAHTAGPGRSALLWWAGSGVLAVAAGMVKQNMLEVFVAAVVLLGVQVLRRAPMVLRSTGAFAGGAVGATAALLGWAAAHGTSRTELWEATVAFRFDAAAVITQWAPSTVDARALRLVGALVGSGALALVALAFVARGDGTRGLSEAGALGIALLAWESLGVAAGGSYWLHYLVGLVSGLVLAAAVAAARRGRTRRLALSVALGFAGVVAAVAVVLTAVHPVTPTPDALGVERYLSAHVLPGDTGVVAFGDPAILQAAGLSSPYPYLWSLPVRVRDPDLAQFSALLRSPARPTWVVVEGTRIGTWGVHPGRAQAPLDREYRLADSVGAWNVLLLRTQQR